MKKKTFEPFLGVVSSGFMRHNRAFQFELLKLLNGGKAPPWSGLNPNKAEPQSGYGFKRTLMHLTACGCEPQDGGFTLFSLRLANLTVRTRLQEVQGDSCKIPN